LNAEVSKPGVSLNTRIFILKLVTNLEDIFSPYAKFWFKPIAEYISEKKNGGVGFHYFTRDLCSLLLAFCEAPYNFSPNPESTEDRLLCSNIVNSLIRVSADKKK